MNDIKYEGTIFNNLKENDKRNVHLELKTTSEAWWIYADGYDGSGGGPVVEIEMDHGVLTVRLWADRREEEATHIISVEGMRKDCLGILRPDHYYGGSHWYPEEDAVRHAKGMWPFTERWIAGSDDDMDDQEDEDDGCLDELRKERNLT